MLEEGTETLSVVALDRIEEGSREVLCDLGEGDLLHEGEAEVDGGLLGLWLRERSEGTKEQTVTSPPF